MALHSLPPQATPKASAGTLWLDKHLAARLSAAFPESPPLDPETGNRTALLRYLRLWQLLRLADSLLRAVDGTRQYRLALGREAVEVLLRAAFAEAGLDVATLLAQCAEPYVDAPLACPYDAACVASLDTARLDSAIRALTAALPFTWPRDLAASPESFLAVSHSDVEGIISLPTSGTTGAAKRIFCTAEDLRETADFFQHGMQYMVRPGRGDHVALLMSGERPGSVGDLLRRGMADLGVACSVPGFVPLTPDGEDAMMARLLALAPTCLVGVPGQVVSLARHPLARRLGAGLGSVLLSGDSLGPAMRGAIGSGFGCEVFLHYGLTETGLGGAVECGRHDGCHTRDADLLHEIVDEAGKPVPAGVWGEIAITTLTRRAMPLLRYRTGDEGRLLPEPCACGSCLGRLQVRGRMSERLSLPDGSSLHVTAFDELLYALPYVRGYRPVLHAQGEATRLALHVLLTADAPADALAAVGKALTALGGMGIERQPEECAGKKLLPVHLYADRRGMEADGDSAQLRRGQAKQSIQRVEEPMRVTEKP
jgi:phenylacetate-coenzyme A ligase PaaK-like adenylate-forming protein